MLGLVILAAALAAGAPAPPADVVVLTNGERVAGFVFEEDPVAGVKLQLEDGTLRHFPRAEVSRVEWGTPPAAPPVPAEPHAAAVGSAPGPEPSLYPLRPAILTASFGLGAVRSAGEVGGNLGDTADWWDDGSLMLVYLDGGFRVTRHLALLLAIDVAVGDASSPIMRWCEAHVLRCGVAAGRVGVQARYAFTPEARTTTWVAAGTGWESAQLYVDLPGTEYEVDAPGSETVSFLGWEILKLGAGVDLRLGRLLGLGLFAYGSVGRFSKVTTEGPAYVVPDDLGGQRLHYWALVGARVILCP